MDLSNIITDNMVEEERRERLQQINESPRERAQLALAYGQVWNTTEMSDDFEVTGFAAPYAIVKRKLDGQVG